MAGELRVSMLFQANAAQAKAEVAGLRAETTKLGQGAATAGKEASSAAPQIGGVGDAATNAAAGLAVAADGAAEWGSYVQMMRAQMQPMVGEAAALASGLQQLAVLEEMGALSAQEAALAHDMLSRKATELIGRMEAAGVSIDGTTAAMRRQDTETQALINGLTGVSNAAELSIADTLRHGQALDDLRARFNPIFAATRQYELQLREIAEAERLGAISAMEAGQARDRAAASMAPIPRQLGQIGAASGAATASLGNLGYQFNDIGMMLAMGQSPFLLMVQQGPQVVQAFEGIKASGVSLGAGLKSALMNMISPMSLVTMGVIGLGAFAVQALMNMGEETKTLGDALSDVAAATREWSTETKNGVSEIEAEFGRLTPAVAALRMQVLQLGEVKALQALRDTIRSLKAETDGGFFTRNFLQSGVETTADLLGVQAQFGSGRTRSDNPEVVKFRSQFEALADAEGPKEQLTLLEQINTQFVAAAGGISSMSAEQILFYDGLVATEAAVRRIISAQQDAARAQIEAARAAGTENARMGGPTFVDRPGAADGSGRTEGRDRAAEMIAAGQQEVELARLKLVYGAQSAEVKAEEARQARAAVEAEIARLGIDRQGAQASKIRQQAAVEAALTEAQRLQTARTAADALMAQHQQDARIVALTAQYGADSLEVAYARAAAERQVYEAQLATQGIVGVTADDLLRAWDAAEGIAAVNMAAGIGAASAQAQLLAAALGVSLAKAIGIMGLAAKAPKVTSRFSFGGKGSAADGLIPGGSAGLSWGDNPTSALSTADTSIPRANTGGAGGGARTEADAVERLIADQERQIEVLRQLDPIQTEIEKNHETLAEATSAERDQVIELIKERMRLEEIRDRLNEIEQAGKNAFVGLVTGAHSFSDAISMVLMRLAEMAASDAWDILWSGGSGGGGGLGGLLSSLFGLGGGNTGGTGELGLPMPFADGGRVPGVGGPREDNIPAWLSVGEYIVNAEATRGALPILEAINAGMPIDRIIDMIGGSRPAFADGGLVAAQASAPRAWFGGSSGQFAQTGGGIGNGQSSAGGEVAVRIFFDSRKSDWVAEVERISGNVATDKVVEGISTFSDQMLPSRMSEISENPRVYG